MHGDDLIDAERRLRAALQPDDDRVRAVIARASSAARPARGRWRALGLAAAMLAFAVIAAGLWQRPGPAPSAVVISGSGSVVVATTSDGRRWVINAERPSTPRGEYVIAFPR